MKDLELTFKGKKEANILYNTPTELELLEEGSKGKNIENTQNKIIIGDNLEVLKILKKTYNEKIKMIYIDPPYNKKTKQIYLDNFKTHSGWLSFMLPRLKLARDLLREDGVIFISIDDNEQAPLKILCDEIFGEENFVSNLCVVDNLKGNNNTDKIVSTNEYCLIYAKNFNCFKIGDLILEETDEELLKWNIDEFGYWKEGRNIKGTGENAPREKRPTMFYPIYLDNELNISLEKSERYYIEVLPITNGQEMCWNWSKEFLEKNKHELIVKRSGDNFNFIKKQRPKFSDLPSRRLKSTCYSPKYSTSISSNIIKNLFGDVIFNYSKSHFLIKDFIQVSTDSSDLILDFFAGSGTTAQAVMELNAEDGGNRKFILVQLPEYISEKNKIAFDFVKNTLGRNEPKISDITIERVNRAGEKIKNSSVDIGYKVYELVSNSIKY